MTISITITLANAAALSVLAAALAEAEKSADAQASRANTGANPEPEAPKTRAARQSTQPAKPAADTQQVASTTHSAGAGQTAAQSVDDAPPFPYVDLQKKVIELHKLDPARTVAIVKSLGFENFKALPHGKWVEAKAAVEAAIDELNAAGEVA